MMYEVFYYDEDVEVSYSYEDDWTGEEDEVIIFRGTLKECMEYVSTHTDPDGCSLFIQDKDGFGVF